jgi:hypothetical protein
METYRFFNSTAEDTRRYNAEEFAEFMRTFYSTGVIAGGEKLKVSRSASTLSVTVSPGTAMVEGYWYCNTQALALPITANNGPLPRVDRVVLRLDLQLDSRSIHLAVKPGTPAASPQPPALTRDENVYEISLAKVQVPVNATAPGVMTDERYQGSVCGITQGLYTVDMSEFDAKQQQMLSDMRAQAQAAVDAITAMSNTALLAKIKALDGSGSGVDADLLDGQHGSYYSNYNNLSNKPTLSSLGGQRTILSGTATPSNTTGQNGDVYIKYV